MNKNNEIRGDQDQLSTMPRDIKDLVDLYVEMNFNDIYNPSLLFQFKIVATQLGFTIEMIERVMKLGRSEYENLMKEVVLSAKSLGT